MVIKKKIALALAVFTCLTTLGGCGNKQTTVNVNGEISESNDNSSKQEVQIESMPVYDYESIPSSAALKDEQYASYYLQYLSEREKIVYDEIYNAAMSYQSELVLSKSISYERLQYIMNIIYLDTPELYMLDTKYEYDIDSNESVSKLYLKYLLTKEEFDKINTKMQENLVYKIGELRERESQIEAEETLIKEITYCEVLSNFDTATEYDYYDLTTSKDLKSSIIPCSTNKPSNVLARAKYFTYICRQIGINSAVVVGEFTNNDYLNKIGLKINNYKDFSDCITQSIDGTHSKVDIDYSHLYAWSIVQLNDEWYHVDLNIDTYYLKYLSESIIDMENEEESFFALVNVDDYTISQSRLFYINEDILGIIPECTSLDMHNLYRNGQYYVNYNDTQIITILNQKIDNLVQNKTKQIVWQFSSENTYNLFINNIDKQIELYNEANNNPIQRYEIEEDKAELVIIMYNMLYI